MIGTKSQYSLAFAASFFDHSFLNPSLASLPSSQKCNVISLENPFNTMTKTGLDTKDTDLLMVLDAVKGLFHAMCSISDICYHRRRTGF